MRNVVWILVAGVLVAGCGNSEQNNQRGVKASGSPKPSAAVSAQNLKISEGVAHLKSGDVKKAIEAFDSAIRQNPTDVRGYLILAETYTHLRQYDRAIDTLTAAIQVAPQSGQAQYLLATNLGLRGDWDLANAHAQKSAEIFRLQQDADNFKRSIALVQGLRQQISKEDVTQ